MIFRKMTTAEVRDIIKQIEKSYLCNLGDMVDNNDFYLSDMKTAVIYFYSKKFSENVDLIIEKSRSINLHPLFIGGIFAYKRGRIWEPDLDVGQLLVNKCGNVIRLNEQLIYKFLYGKELLIKETFNFAKGIVVDYNMKFMGYASLRKVKNMTKLIPENDLGYYLRSGH
ncbi:hypothetical protein HS7_07910 [Sulfolobales archaeon HS-7]|nr:hypothetical protein HS7_07910 [Sulfolobales archaeon HS-7]